MDDLHEHPVNKWGASWMRGPTNEQNIQTIHTLVDLFLNRQLERLGLDIRDVKLCYQYDGITTTYWLEPKKEASH
jgi:hypothetical protein